MPNPSELARETIVTPDGHKVLVPMSGDLVRVTITEVDKDYVEHEHNEPGTVLYLIVLTTKVDHDRTGICLRTNHNGSNRDDLRFSLLVDGRWRVGSGFYAKCNLEIIGRCEVINLPVVRRYLDFDPCD